MDCKTTMEDLMELKPTIGLSEKHDWYAQKTSYCLLIEQHFRPHRMLSLLTCLFCEICRQKFLPSS